MNVVRRRVLVKEVGGTTASSKYDRYYDDDRFDRSDINGFNRDDDWLGVLPGGLDPCLRAFDNSMCCLLLI